MMQICMFVTWPKYKFTTKDSEGYELVLPIQRKLSWPIHVHWIPRQLDLGHPRQFSKGDFCICYHSFTRLHGANLCFARRITWAAGWAETQDIRNLFPKVFVHCNGQIHYLVTPLRPLCMILFYISSISIWKNHQKGRIFMEFLLKTKCDPLAPAGHQLNTTL